MPAARADLEDAFSYLNRRSPSAAEALLNRATRAASSLETLSERGRLVRDLERLGYREIIVDRFRLVYAVEEDRVRVVAFVHGARNFARWWRESGR